MNIILALAASCIVSGNAAITPPTPATVESQGIIELRHADAQERALSSGFESRYFSWGSGLLSTRFCSTPGGGLVILVR